MTLTDVEKYTINATRELKCNSRYKIATREINSTGTLDFRTHNSQLAARKLRGQLVD